MKTQEATHACTTCKGTKEQEITVNTRGRQVEKTREQDQMLHLRRHRATDTEADRFYRVGKEAVVQVQGRDRHEILRRRRTPRVRQTPLPLHHLRTNQTNRITMKNPREIQNWHHVSAML